MEATPSYDGNVSALLVGKLSECTNLKHWICRKVIACKLCYRVDGSHGMDDHPSRSVDGDAQAYPE
jgi:hypothetical protein